MKPGEFSSGVAVGVLLTLAGTEVFGQTLTIACVAGSLVLACVVGFVLSWLEIPRLSRAVHEPTDAPDLGGGE